MSKKFNDKFQLRVVALMFRDKSFLQRAVNILRPHHFTKEEYSLLVSAIFRFYQEYQYAPRRVEFEEYLKKVLSKEHKQDWFDYCKQALSKISKLDLSEVDFIKDSLIEFMQSTEFTSAIEENIGADGNVDVDRLVEQLVKIKDFKSLFDVDCYDYKKEIGSRFKWLKDARNQVNRFKTFIPDIDNYLEFGGLSGGELFVTLAPTNRGKSLFLGNIARANISNGKDILMITCEMAAYKQALRIDQQILGISKIELADSPRSNRKALKRIVREYGNLRIKKYGMRQATVGMIESFITHLRLEGFDPDLVIIDYADILKSTVSKGEKRHEQTEIYESLASLAWKLDRPIITASQANRQALSKEVSDLQNMAEAIDKANVADIVVVLNQTKAMKKKGRMNFYFAKMRDEASGVISKARIDYMTTRIFGMTEEELLADEEELNTDVE